MLIIFNIVKRILKITGKSWTEFLLNGYANPVENELQKLSERELIDKHCDGYITTTQMHSELRRRQTHIKNQPHWRIIHLKKNRAQIQLHEDKTIKKVINININGKGWVNPSKHKILLATIRLIANAPALENTRSWMMPSILNNLSNNSSSQKSVVYITRKIIAENWNWIPFDRSQLTPKQCNEELNTGRLDNNSNQAGIKKTGRINK